MVEFFQLGLFRVGPLKLQTLLQALYDWMQGAVGVIGAGQRVNDAGPMAPAPDGKY